MLADATTSTQVCPLPEHTARPTATALAPTALASLIACDLTLFKKLGWQAFVEHIRATTDFESLSNVDNPAQRLLKFYKERGAPAKMSTAPWSRDQISAALARGAHRSCMDHLEFLE